MVSHNGVQHPTIFAKTSKVIFSVITWYAQMFYYLPAKVQLYIKNFVSKITKINKDDHY